MKYPKNCEIRDYDRRECRLVFLVSQGVAEVKCDLAQN